MYTHTYIYIYTNIYDSFRTGVRVVNESKLSVNRPIQICVACHVMCLVLCVMSCLVCHVMLCVSCHVSRVLSCVVLPDP